LQLTDIVFRCQKRASLGGRNFATHHYGNFVATADRDVGIENAKEVMKNIVLVINGDG
jgi:hypothetical protein